jgi:anti-sigma factor ChrR (cupin superfamily)
MMKRLRSLPIFFAVTAALVFAQQPGQTKAKAAIEASIPVFLHPGDLKWADLDPKGAPGIQIADVRGDHAKGTYSAFLKFPAGFLSPLHTHTYAIKILVVSGTYTQAPEGKPTQRMGPGSYVFQPDGDYKHVSGCDKASDCVLFVDSDGPFDLKPVAAGTI